MVRADAAAGIAELVDELDDLAGAPPIASGAGSPSVAAEAGAQHAARRLLVRWRAEQLEVRRAHGRDTAE